MGSASDAVHLEPARTTLKEFGVSFEFKVVSAHRTPDHMFRYAEEAAGRGIKVIIAAAGGSAHLPGMVASKTILPVIGVPVKSKTLNGVDSLLSIIQMPAGVPVATVAIDGAINAALLALRILSLKYPKIAAQLRVHRKNMRNNVLKTRV
jgi:5-(carboxyamino)imidazole ribonucleotide mutase